MPCHCHAVRPRIPNSETVAVTIPDAGNLVPTFYVCFRLFSSFSPGKSATAVQAEVGNNKHCYMFCLRLLAFLMPDRIDILQAHRITAVAFHLGVFQGIVFFLRFV